MMRRTLLVTLLAAGIAGGLVARAPAAWSCSCIQATPEQHYQDAAYVFSATVTSVQAQREPEAVGGQKRITLSLVEIFKGRLPRVVEVTTPFGGAACGVSFIAGSTYTVFASGGDGGLATSSCSGTTDDSQVRARMRALADNDAGFEGTPLAAPAPVDEASASRNGPIAAAGALIALAGISVLWRWRRRATVLSG